MTRFILTFSSACLLPGAALAFCGGWDTPVALGFGGDSWAAKWPILGGILLFVMLFTSLIIRQVRAARALGPDEA